MNGLHGFQLKAQKLKVFVLVRLDKQLLPWSSPLGPGCLWS